MTSCLVFAGNGVHPRGTVTLPRAAQNLPTYLWTAGGRAKVADVGLHKFRAGEHKPSESDPAYYYSNNNNNNNNLFFLRTTMVCRFVYSDCDANVNGYKERSEFETHWSVYL